MHLQKDVANDISYGRIIESSSSPIRYPWSYIPNFTEIKQYIDEILNSLIIYFLPALITLNAFPSLFTKSKSKLLNVLFSIFDCCD